ncbi:hypothetical protein GUJ93_ZPchr0009g1031 [Zizania palustris]|uniref:Uncharacterized protein n=1 Tax=Zizania palustris TaxID=103762 RepID=A0A8J5VK72_ZIZPA|nr:hypothetical protein GUJ93_ZPchr0009g1031 [Zizania palustris]
MDVPAFYQPPRSSNVTVLTHAVLVQPNVSRLVVRELSAQSKYLEIRISGSISATTHIMNFPLPKLQISDAEAVRQAEMVPLTLGNQPSQFVSFSVDSTAAARSPSSSSSAAPSRRSPTGYRHLLELLAKEGFLPSWWSPFHESAAREVFERFHGCYDALLTLGLPEAGLNAMDTEELPLYSVGHRSNGALLLLLVGSYFSEKIPKANVIVSFNNRPASEVVPYFKQITSLHPTHILHFPCVENVPGSGRDAWKALFDLARGFIQEYDKEAMVSLTKFVHQLPSVMNQVI